jgi:hypothetical protein
MNDERWAASGKDELVPNETRARVILMALSADIVQLARLLLHAERKKDAYASYFLWRMTFPFFLFFSFFVFRITYWLIKI